MMTRKDYVETARILNKYKTSIDEKDFIDLVDDFSFMFEKDNERFNTEKFVEACNVIEQIYYFVNSVSTMGSNYLCNSFRN